MFYTTYLTVPRLYRKAITHLFINAVKTNLLKPFIRKQSNAEMIEGFTKRYTNNNLYQSYLDGAVNWYLDPIHHCEAHLSEIPNTADTFVLDIGCGPASICYWLRTNNYKWQYIGVDIIKQVEKYIKPLNNASFISKKIENITIDDLPQKPDIIFAVNSLCYVKDAKNTLENLFNISKPETKLIIIDIYPSLFWDKKSIANLRSTHNLQKILNDAGWAPKKKLILSIYNFANIPLMKISHSFLCERS